jgi:4-hydroxybenzoate polyprenyltransferase
MFALLRPYQWYKNLLVFAALFFSHNLFHLSLLGEAAVGFVLLCCVASAGYCINDVVDAKADTHHADKKKRPVASGQVSKAAAIAVAVVLYGIGLGAAYFVDKQFFIVLAAMALLSLWYSLYLKHILFLDILIIAVLFVLRALAGVFIIDVKLSPWFLLEIFFLAIFLVAAKRHSDGKLLAEKSRLHKPVLVEYTSEVVFSLLHMSVAALVVFFSLYAFFTDKLFLFVLLPLFMFGLLRYYFLTLQGHPLVRRPELLLLAQDKQLFFTGFLFLIGVFVVYYV